MPCVSAQWLDSFLVWRLVRKCGRLRNCPAEWPEDLWASGEDDMGEQIDTSNALSSIEVMHVASIAHLFELFEGGLFLAFALFCRSRHLLAGDTQLDQIIFQAHFISHAEEMRGVPWVAFAVFRTSLGRGRRMRWVAGFIRDEVVRVSAESCSEKPPIPRW